MYSNIFPFQSFASLLLKKTIPGGWVVGWVVVLNENITTSAPIELGLGLSLAIFLRYCLKAICQDRWSSMCTAQCHRSVQCINMSPTETYYLIILPPTYVSRKISKSQAGQLIYFGFLFKIIQPSHISCRSDQAI